MKSEELETVKKEVLRLGEQTASYLFVTTTADGDLIWRRGGPLKDNIFSLRIVDVLLDSELKTIMSKQRE